MRTRQGMEEPRANHETLQGGHRIWAAPDHRGWGRGLRFPFGPWEAQAFRQRMTWSDLVLENFFGLCAEGPGKTAVQEGRPARTGPGLETGA